MASPAACLPRLQTAVLIAAAATLLASLQTYPAAAAYAAPGGLAGSFSGRFVSGTGDSRYLELLDIARRQYASDEHEHESVLSLYRGDWDGLMEGPGWGAWWTQNSYGPTMAGLPFMGPVAWHATQHSMAWWFDSMGNGTKV